MPPPGFAILFGVFAAHCNTTLLPGVGLSGNNIEFANCATTFECGARCCERVGCAAWTWVNRSGAKAPVCYLKSAAVPEACEPGEVCVSWSRSPLPPPPSPSPCASTRPCDRGWQKDAEGCCTRLALSTASSPVGIMAFPPRANLSTDVWEDRAYPWGGDAVLSADGTEVHGFFAEFANHCPMTYGTWYSSTQVRHAVAPADSHTGLPSGPFVPADIAIPRAAGNPVLLTKGAAGTTADGYHVLFTTNHRFPPPVRNCAGRDPAIWHKEAVYVSE